MAEKNYYISINPGSGATDDGGYDLSYGNMLQFITDSKFPLEIESYENEPVSNGRYKFILKTSLDSNHRWEILMPAIPLDQLRYMEEENQNIFDFYRLYINDSSWIWKFGIDSIKYDLEHY